MTHSLNVCLEHTPLVGYICTSLTMVYLWTQHTSSRKLEKLRLKNKALFLDYDALFNVLTFAGFACFRILSE